MKKLLRVLLIILGVLLLLYVIRIPMLKGIGSYLRVNDPPKKTEVMFVLSGGAFDRGSYAALLFNAGYANRIVCTGGNPDFELLAFGKNIYECELTRMVIKRSIADSTFIDTLRRGTSTLEERDAVLEYCKQKNIKSCMIVSSPFHTRRIDWLFRKPFRKNGIDICIEGCVLHGYNADEWWKNEYGLLDVNNEYVKLSYYLLKYGFTPTIKAKK